MGQAVLAGTIRDDSTGRPLEGAEILIESSAKRGLSQASGRYSIDGLAPGSHIALVRLVGYAPVRIAFRTSGTDTTWLNALLAASVQPLEPVTVEAKPDVIAADRLRTFEENRRLGFGKFMDSTYLRKWDVVNFKALVARVPGVGVVCDQRFAHGSCYATTLRSGCRMRVFVDGMPSRLDDIGKDWRVSELEAVEIYRSAAEIPAEYNSASSACGVLALWTRKP